jgi:hypothetical protein
MARSYRHETVGSQQEREHRSLGMYMTGSPYRVTASEVKKDLALAIVNCKMRKLVKRL